ncbi:hypothetical protein WM23_07735 [Burkholderia ubonensis]|nr:hypothetical protein WM23_07735 [Burkholderia ubonensis]
MPVRNVGKYIVNRVAVGTRQQFSAIDDNYAVPDVIGRKDAFQASERIRLMAGELDNPCVCIVSLYLIERHSPLLKRVPSQAGNWASLRATISH